MENALGKIIFGEENNFLTGFGDEQKSNESRDDLRLISKASLSCCSKLYVFYFQYYIFEKKRRKFNVE